jgi:ribosomal protein S18 acetylase RimI-like enzyme
METRERIYETGLGYYPALSGAQICSCRSGGGIAKHKGTSRLPKATLSVGALVAAWIALYLNGQAPRTDGTASTVAAFVVNRRVSNGASHRINNTISLLILNDDFTTRATDSFIFSSSLSSSPTQLYLHSLSSPTTEERVEESISDSSDFPSISLSRTPLSLKALRVRASEPAVRSIRVDQLSRVALPLRENSSTEAKLTASLVRSETGRSNGTRKERPFLESSSPKLNVNYSALLHSASGFQHPQAVDEDNGDLSVLPLTGKNSENSALQEPTQRHMDETKISATLFWHRLTSLKRLPPSLSTDPNPSEIIVTKSTAIPPEGANSTSTRKRTRSNAAIVGPTNCEQQAKLVSVPSESLSSTSVQLLSSRARFVAGPEACSPSHASLSLDSPHVRVLNGTMRAPPLQKGYDAAIKVFFGFLRPRGVFGQTNHAQATNVQGILADSKREASKNRPVADVEEFQESVSPTRIKSTDVSRDVRNNETGMEGHRSKTDVISKQVQVDCVGSIAAGSVSLSVTSTRRHRRTSSKSNYRGDRQASDAPESRCSSVLIRGDSRLPIAASSNSAQSVLALVHVPKSEPRQSSVSGLTASAPTARAAEARNSSFHLTQPFANVDSEPLRVDEHAATTVAPESPRDPIALVCDSVSSAEGESVATSLICNSSQIASLVSESKLMPLSDIGHISSGKQTTWEDSPTEHLGYDYVLTRIAAFVSRSRILSPPRVDAVRSEANSSSHFPHVDQLSPVLASANLGDGTEVLNASAACDESEAGLFAAQANSITSTVGGPSPGQSSLLLNETIPCDWRAPVFGNESIVAPEVAVHLQVDDTSNIATGGLSSAQNASLAGVLDVSRAIKANEHVVSSVAIPLDGQRLKAEFLSTLAGRNSSRSSGWKKPGAGKPNFLQTASSPSQVYLHSLTVANAMETVAEVAPAPLNIRFRTKRKLAASSATPGQIENRRNVTMVNPTEQTGDDGVVNPSEQTNDDRRSETDGGKSSDDQSASGNNEGDGDDDGIRRKRAAMIRQSLAHTAARKSSDRAKETSVGQRREGSATRYRRATEGGGTRLSDAIRRTARVSTILKEKTNDKTPPIPVVDPTSPKIPDEGPHNDFLLSSSNTLSLSASRIQDAIGGMLDSMIAQQPQDQLSSFLQNCASAVVATTTNFLPFNQTAAFSDFSRTGLWLLREWGISIDQEIFHRPFGLYDTDFGSLKQHGGLRETMMYPRQKYKSLVLDVNNGIVVRTATPSDDIDIANLRLSVFSDFSVELQNQFCARSCEALSSRRRRGAVCVVATAASAGAGGERFSSTNNLRLPASFEHDNSNQILLGTAECSSHEFFGTRLGQRRRRHSLLYIAEVAVHPAARRRGVGRRLLESVESIARLMGSEADRNPQMRNKGVVETLFLHVDVQNHAAIAMYEKAGYRRVDSMYPMFLEFTTSLNLHPGATKGRDHYLLYKNLVEDPVWLPDPYVELLPLHHSRSCVEAMSASLQVSSSGREHSERRSLPLGFEIQR